MTTIVEVRGEPGLFKTTDLPSEEVRLPMALRAARRLPWAGLYIGIVGLLLAPPGILLLLKPQALLEYSFIGMVALAGVCVVGTAAGFCILAPRSPHSRTHAAVVRCSFSTTRPCGTSGPRACRFRGPISSTRRCDLRVAALVVCISNSGARSRPGTIPCAWERSPSCGNDDRTNCTFQLCALSRSPAPSRWSSPRWCCATAAPPIRSIRTPAHHCKRLNPWAIARRIFCAWPRRTPPWP
jgi:hypothetical protein